MEIFYGTLKVLSAGLPLACRLLNISPATRKFIIPQPLRNDPRETTDG